MQVKFLSPHRDTTSAKIIEGSFEGEFQGQMIYLTRRAEFSASHYYHSPALTLEENQRLYGKCNNPRGHGHNYVLEVTVRGEVDTRSGMVVDLKELKEVLHREVLDALDHRFLNEEVPAFRHLIPTTENLAVEIWKMLSPKIAICELHRIRLYETPDLYVDYFGPAKRQIPDSGENDGDRSQTVGSKDTRGS